MKGYDLTPLGPNWTWRERVLEIVVQTISIVLFIRPMMAFYNWLLWRRWRRQHADEIKYRQGWP